MCDKKSSSMVRVKQSFKLHDDQHWETIIYFKRMSVFPGKLPGEELTNKEIELTKEFEMTNQIINAINEAIPDNSITTKTYEALINFCELFAEDNKDL